MIDPSEDSTTRSRGKENGLTCKLTEGGDPWHARAWTEFSATGVRGK